MNAESSFFSPSFSLGPSRSGPWPGGVFTGHDTRNLEAPASFAFLARASSDTRFDLAPTPLPQPLLALGGAGQQSALQDTSVGQSQMTPAFQTFALGTTQNVQPATPKHPAFVDNAAWVKQSSAKDPKAWSLVWDSQVTEKKTWVDNYVSGTPVYYSFDIKDSQADYAKSGYLRPMTDEQKENTRKALQELSNATGVTFVEKPGSSTGMVLAQADLSSGDDKYSTMGQHMGARLNSGVYQHTIMVNEHIYGKESLKPGTSGYETMLHELGHAAGLDDAKFDLGKKYENLDNTKYTLMSYNGDTNATRYAELDKRAFSILYPPDLRPKPKQPVAMKALAEATRGEIEPVEDTYYDEESSDEISLAGVNPGPHGRGEPEKGTGAGGSQGGSQKPVEEEPEFPPEAFEDGHGDTAEAMAAFRLAAPAARLDHLPGPEVTPLGVAGISEFTPAVFKLAQGVLA